MLVPKDVSVHVDTEVVSDLSDLSDHVTVNVIVVLLVWGVIRKLSK